MGNSVVFQSGAVGAAVVASTTAASLSVMSLCKQAKKVTENTNSLIDQVKGIISNLADQLRKYGGFVWKVAIAAYIFWLSQNADVGLLWGAVLAVLGLYVPELLGWAKELVSIRFQSGVSTVSTLLMMIQTCWCPGKDTTAVANEFTRKVSQFPRARDGLEKFVESVLGLMEGFINFVLDRFGKDNISLTQNNTLLTKWRKKSIEYLKWMAANPVLKLEKLKEIREHYLEGFGFLQVLTTPESKREVTIWIDKLGLALKPHEGALSASNNVRAMPYMMMFGGGSGVGKTSLVRYVATIALWLSGEVSAKDALSQLWQKGTTEYWNGYVGQKCLVMDDAFQVKGVAGQSDSEAMQVIRAVGNWSYPLNFADVESKGKFYLNTPLIVGTTNSSNIKADWQEFITCPEAVVRRFQSAYWVELNPSYANEGRFDYEMVTSMVHKNVKRLAERSAANEELTFEDIMSAIPWDAWVIHPHRFDSNIVTDLTDARGLRGVVEDAARAIRDRKVKNDQEVDDIQALLDMLEHVPKPVEFQSGGNVESFEIPTTFDLPPNTPDKVLDWLENARDAIIADTIAAEEAARLLEEHQETANRSWMETLSAMVSSAADSVRSMAQFCGGNFMTGFLHGLSDVDVLVMGSGILAAVVMGLCAAVRASWKILTGVLGWLGLKIVGRPEMQSNEGKAVTKSKQKDMSFASPTTVLSVNFQAGASQEDTYDKVYRNVVKMELIDEEGKYYADLGHMLGVCNDVYILPYHYREDLAQNHINSRLRLAKAVGTVKMEMSVREFLQLRFTYAEGYDLMAVAMGVSGLKQSKSITHLFLTEKEICSILRGNNMASRLYVTDSKVVKGTDGMVTTRERSIYTSNTTEYMHGGLVASGKRLAGVVKYRIPTRPGHCGAPLLLDNIEKFGNRCIMALHSAGRDSIMSREGYGTLVSRETVMALICQIVSYAEVVANDDEYKQFGIRQLTNDEVVRLESTGLLGGSFECLGMLDKPVNIGTKSKLMVSEMQEEQLFGPSPSLPAVLRMVTLEDREVYPMVNGLSAYKTEVEYKRPDKFDRVVDMAMKKHREATHHHPKDVLSFEEAIEPPIHWKLKPLNRKSSAGYKYRDWANPVTPGKTWALGHEGDITWDSPGLAVVRKDVEHLVAEAKQGRRTMHLCIDFLKDELRPLKKVQSVATRVISGTEMDYTVACRMYFGAFMAATFDTFVVNGMAPGINHYTEWSILAQALMEKGTKMFDGDFSRFDSSEQPYMHQAILSYINAWYRMSPTWKKEDENVRTILWLDLVHSRHISGVGNVLDTVVQWNKSLPSGHPLTTIVNSMYSLISIAWCYVRRVGDYNMWDNAYVCTFGDDNVTSVSDEISDQFNQVTVAETMAELGLVYTSGKKDAELVPYTTIDDITFLKRSFVIDEDVNGIAPNLGWIAPLAPESFLYEGYWYKNARDRDGDMVRRVEHMLGELSLHDADMWEQYGPKVIKWCLDKDLRLQHYSRGAWREFIKTRMDVWF